MLFHFDFFPDGYTFSDILGTLRSDPVALFNLLILIAAFACVLFIRIRWISRRKITVRMTPPDHLTSAEAGFALNGKCEEQDVTSLLLALAVDGCISIDQFDKKAFRIQALREPPESAAPEFHMLYDAVSGAHNVWQPFPGGTPLRRMQQRIGSGYDAVHEEITGRYKEERSLFSRSGEKMASVSWLIWFFGLAAAAFLTAFRATDFEDFWMSLLMTLIWSGTVMVFLVGITAGVRDRKRESAFGRMNGLMVVLFFYGLFAAIGAFACSLQFTPFNTGMLLVFLTAGPFLFLIGKPRTETGRALKEESEGLRKWIEMPDREKLRELTEKDPLYPYRLLPYAYVFGAEESWVSRFDGISVPDAPCFTASYSSAVSTAESGSEENGHASAVQTGSCARFVIMFDREIHSIVEDTSVSFHRTED